MKYLRCGLTLIFSLLLVAVAQAQTEQGNLRVIVRPDGLIIRYNDQARRDALRPGGALRMAQDVINELERQCSGCYRVGRDQLAVQLFGHAAGYYAPNEWIQRHAREANLTWGQLKNPFSRDFYRGAIRTPDRGQAPYAQSPLRGAQDRERAAAQDRQAGEAYKDRMAARVPQATQQSRLSDRMGLAPKIERRDLTGPFRGYLDSKALDRNVGSSTPQRSSAERSTPQRSDSQERTRSDKSPRSGGGSPSRDTRERSGQTCSTARC